MERATRIPEGLNHKVLPFDRLANGETRYVYATFADIETAKGAVDALEREGCLPSDVTLEVADARRRHRVRTHPEFEGLDPHAVVVDPVELDRCRMTLRGAGLGALVGGPLGALAGWAAIVTWPVAAGPGVGGLAAPSSVGLLAVTVMAALAGAGLFGTTGAIVGGMFGMHSWEYRARRLERTVRDGRVLLRARARTEDELERAADVLANGGGEVAILESG